MVPVLCGNFSQSVYTSLSPLDATDASSFTSFCYPKKVLLNINLGVEATTSDEEDLKLFGRMLLDLVRSTLPSLQSLLLGDNASIDVDICKELLSRCTSLRELHLYPDFE